MVKNCSKIYLIVFIKVFHEDYDFIPLLQLRGEKKKSFVLDQSPVIGPKTVPDCINIFSG